MLNVKFPDTDVVSCVFSLKSSNCRYDGSNFNEFDIVENPNRLKRYNYRVPEYLRGQLRVGDFVVVYCQTGYQVCQVWGINETVPESFTKLAPVVAKFSLTEFFEDLAKQEQLKRMKETLLRERKRLEEQVTWDLIAEKSPEFAQMLKAFREAGGEF